MKDSWKAPASDVLASAAGSRFLAVRVASVRARQIADYSRGEYTRGTVPPLTTLGAKPLSAAMVELAEGKVTGTPRSTPTDEAQ